MSVHIEHTEPTELPPSDNIEELFERLEQALLAERKTAFLHLPTSRQITCTQCGTMQAKTDAIIRQIKVRFEEVMLQRDGARGALRKTMARLPKVIEDPEANLAGG